MLHLILLTLVTTSIMRRRGPRLSIHPTRKCESCCLCGQSSAYCAHPLMWSNDIKERSFQMENVDEHSCIYKACELDIKRHINTDGFLPWWRLRVDNSIVPTCKATSKNATIIYTGLFSIQQVRELLNVSVPSTTEGKNKLTPLCQCHYKEIHRLSHAHDDMYGHQKCSACNATLRGPSRYSPNPARPATPGRPGRPGWPGPLIPFQAEFYFAPLIATLSL